MIRHPFTLTRSATELQSMLHSAILSEAWVTEQDVVVLCWDKGREQWDLECHLREPYISVFLRPHQGRPRHNTKDILELGLGGMVRQVRHLHPDRILRIETQRVSVHIQLFGGGRANVMLVNPDEYVVDAVRHRHELLGKELQLKALSFVGVHEVDQSITLLKYLSNGDHQLDIHYARELLHELQLSETMTLRECGEELIGTCFRAAEQFRERCLNTKDALLLASTNSQELLSFVPLQGWSESARYATVQQAIQWRVIHLHREHKRKVMHDALWSTAQKEVRKLHQALEHMQDITLNSNRHQHLQYQADLLLSQPNVHQSALSEITVTGWQGEQLTIELDASKNLAENAQRYYDKARRSREAVRVNLERQPRYQSRLADLQALQSELQADISMDRLQELYNQRIPKMNSKDGAKTPADATQYRQFELSAGYTLYVGRSAANNDELTMRFARQNDLWFHARGVSGSHAVLRCQDNTKVPKHILEQAASIAAYYSKARNAKYTPVVYTQRKYVRKPKGAAVGAVQLEREEVIMVTPQLPAGMQDTD